MGLVLASVNLHMKPEPQAPGLVLLGVRETVVEWESRVYGVPLPILKDIPVFPWTPRLPAVPISHALDINFPSLLKEGATHLLFKTAQIYSCLVLEVRF